MSLHKFSPAPQVAWLFLACHMLRITVKARSLFFLCRLPAQTAFHQGLSVHGQWSGRCSLIATKPGLHSVEQFETQMKYWKSTEELMILQELCFGMLKYRHCSWAEKWGAGFQKITDNHNCTCCTYFPSTCVIIIKISWEAANVAELEADVGSDGISNRITSSQPFSFWTSAR